jgi:ELWxxDGT repeat protein
MTSRPARRPARRRARRTGRSVAAALALTAAVAGALATGSDSAATSSAVTAAPVPFGAGAYLVRDGAPGETSGVTTSDLEPLDAVVLQGRVYYRGTDGVHGDELWVTDGTASGTRMVKDLAPGDDSSAPGAFAVMAGKMYFSATTATGEELWVSDGTSAGTHLLADVGGPTTSSAPSGLTVAGGRLWFVAETTTPSGPTGRELFVSDGTAAGTRLVADIAPGPASSYVEDVVALAGGGVAFFATAAGTDSELWASDGTAAGTGVVRDLNGTEAGSVAGDLVTLGDGTLLFAGNSGTGWRLWRSDGTHDGTVAVDPSATAVADPIRPVALGGLVYFLGHSPQTGTELFRTDGTAGGTTVVADLVPGPGSSKPGYPGVAGGQVWFEASTAVGRTELWSYRPGGTARMRDVLATGGVGTYLHGYADVNGEVFFSAEQGVGNELYTVDRTGVRLVADHNVGGPSFPSLPVALGATALYAAASDTVGRELFAYNTQPTTTRLTAPRRVTARRLQHRPLRVRVTVTGGPFTHRGAVLVRDRARVVGTGWVSRGVAAVRITRRLAPGRHRLTAGFAGSTVGRSSTSRAVRLSVVRAR